MDFFLDNRRWFQKIAKCKSCKMVVSAKSDRLKVHRQKCVVTSELDESEIVTSVASVPLPDSVPNP